MDTVNNYDPHRGDKANIRPIAEATSKKAKEEIVHYRSLGIPASELGIVRDFPGGPELVVVNKAGLMKLAKLSPLGGVEAAARIQSALADSGHQLTFDEELDIAGTASGEGREAHA